MANNVHGTKQILPPGRTNEVKIMPQKDPAYDPMKDRQVDVGGQGGSIKFNGSKGNVDSWYLTQNSQVRLNFYTSAGYSSGKIQKNHKTCADRGYMMDPKDWRDVEMTVYIKHKGGSGDDEYVLYCRGGTHTGDGNCEGCAYKADVSFSGQVRVAKEQWHVHYVFQDWKNVGLGDIEDKWFGFKFLAFNVPSGSNKIAVMLQIWIDDSDAQNKWEKVYEYLDDSGWGDGGGKCSGKSDQVLSWGGPNATLRVDNSDGFDFKFVAITEVNPGGSFEPPPGGSGGGPSGGGGPPPLPELPEPVPISNVLTSNFTDYWNINVDTGETCTITGPIEERELVVLEGFPINPTDNYIAMPLTRTRCGWFAGLDISKIQGQAPREVKVTVKKGLGSPTGLIKCRIRKDTPKEILDTGDSSVIAEIGSFDVALLTTADTEVVFTNLSNTKQIPHDGRLLVEFEGGDSNNYIMVKVADQDPYDGPATNLIRFSPDTGYETQKSFDMAGSIAV